MKAAAESDQPRRQYTTTYLFMLTLVVAVAMLPIAYWGLDAVCLTVWLGLAGLAFLHAHHRTAVSMTVAIVVVPLLMTQTCGPMRVPPAAKKSQCINQMRQIAVAIKIYESVNGHFPPPYVADEHGTPIHSWRVLILPFMEKKSLYDQYDFTKPWDHPVNAKLATKMPSVYRCPAERLPSSDVSTPYIAVVGHDTMWPPSGVRTAKDVADGRKKPLLLVESRALRTHWMAPNDADMTSFLEGVKSGT